MPPVCNGLQQRPAIFLDRDGTLNEDSGYLYEISAWRWLPGAVEALAMLSQKGYALVVISNQSGIARGYYTAADVHTLHTWLNTTLAKEGLCIDAFYHCPHHPEFSEPCSCRKPSPHMLLQAAQDLQLDLSRSYMVGDKISDVQAGLAAGCTSYLIDAKRVGQSQSLAQEAGVHYVSSLFAAAQAICAD